MKALIIAALLIAVPAQAQFYPPQNQPVQPSQYGATGQRPAPGNIYVPVPSAVYEIGKGYVPSVGLAEVPGRQLNTPLSTALGYDNVPVQPIQPSAGYVFPSYGYGR